MARKYSILDFEEVEVIDHSIIWTVLTAMYMMTLVAFIGAINARGTARTVVSYFLAVFCLCASAFHTARELVSPRVISASPNASLPAPQASPAPMTQSVSTEESPAGAAHATSNAEAVAADAAREAYIDEANAVLASALELTRTMASIQLTNLVELGEAEYEALQSRAVSAVAQARRIRSNFSSLKSAPASLESTHRTASQGIESLMSSAIQLERFFKAENREEEEQRRQAFRSGNQQAIALLNRATGTMR